MRSTLVIGVMVCVAISCGESWAASSQRIMIADLTAKTPVVVVVDPGVSCLQQTLSDACQSLDGRTPKEVQAAATCLKSESDMRWISRQGDDLRLYVVYQGADPAVRFNEQSRKTRISTDLSNLIKLARSAKLLEGAKPDDLKCVEQSYELERVRSNLAVTVEQTPAAPRAVAMIEAAGPTASTAAAAAAPKATTTIITGPAEHWYLSADLPIRHFNELKRNDTSGLIEPAKTPTTFFVGVDYALGDILGESQSWRRDFVLKGMLKFSKQPLQTFGIALGYRGPALSSLGLSFEVVSPFAGYFWSRPEVPEGSSGAETKLQGTFQFGFSFNLDTALGWAKAEK